MRLCVLFEDTLCLRKLVSQHGYTFAIENENNDGKRKLYI